MFWAKWKSKYGNIHSYFLIFTHFMNNTAFEYRDIEEIISLLLKLNDKTLTKTEVFRINNKIRTN